MTANARDPQGAASQRPPSGLTPPSGGATAPDPREAQVHAAADALAEVFSDRCLGCRLRQPVVELSDGWWHERVGPDRFEMQCALFDNERSALAAYRSVSAPASARSAALEEPARAAPPREASGGGSGPREKAWLDWRRRAQSLEDPTHHDSFSAGWDAALAPTSPVAGAPEGGG